MKGLLFIASSCWTLLPIHLLSAQVTDSVSLKEVVIKAGRTPKSNSRWSDMQPIDLVTIGGANGDLYKALETLPGTQVQGESGRLLVRGGSSNETQTYIDGMHVLNPYTSTGANAPARGRYSTFMFSGVNLASGGQSQEYGEALSAVLPLETKDRSLINKLGISPSIVGIGGGGTRVLPQGSLSMNLDYQNLTLYNRLFPGRIEFEQPYRLFSCATQLRYTPDRTVCKVYASYDRTDFSNNVISDPRLFELGEDNIYLNATCRRTFSDWNWFVGTAYSHFHRQIGSAITAGDTWSEQQQELHLKAKLSRYLRPSLRVDVGVESFIRSYRTRYLLNTFDVPNAMHPTIEACFVSSTYYPLESLKAELSFRTEYTSLNRETNFSPRFALNYQYRRLMFSTTVGRYTQLPDPEYLARQSALHSEACLQYNMGVQYEADGRFYKAECYWKQYDRLALLTSNELTSDGYGTSKGVDLFFSDRTLLTNLEYQLSYSFSLSQRKYREYTELTTPQYATRHNAALVLKYTLPKLRTIVSITNRCSSGRPYHNPNRSGWMNDEVKPYNSLDFGLTFLASKKVILHTSVSNILGRKNEFGRIDEAPILASNDHFLYFGLFITLGKKAAYDVSNF